jgi:trk system potassium uptake protein TrkH
MDILGTESLTPWVTDPIVNINTMVLIILGGIGFFVWFDLLKTAGKMRKRKKEAKGYFASLSLHTRLVLVTSALLVFGGALLIALLEWTNPDTLGALSVPQRVMAALFQSVTTRTAGFQTIPQENFRDATSFISMVLMLIGGSPMGTAGGIKTTTVAITVLTVFSYLKGRDSTEVYNRRLRLSDVRVAIVILTLEFGIVFVGTVLLSAVTGADSMDVVFEVASAMGTVGLTRGLTPLLNGAGKLILMVIMYCGRIGPVTLAMAITVRSSREKKQIQFPEEKIMIG